MQIHFNYNINVTCIYFRNITLQHNNAVDGSHVSSLNENDEPSSEDTWPYKEKHVWFHCQSSCTIILFILVKRCIISHIFDSNLWTWQYLNFII